jgi:hypothetical protein
VDRLEAVAEDTVVLDRQVAAFGVAMEIAFADLVVVADTLVVEWVVENLVHTEAEVAQRTVVPAQESGVVDQR